MTTKRALRKTLLDRRRHLDADWVREASARICTHLEVWLSQHPPDFVFAYFPHAQEPDLRSLAARFTWAAPRIGPDKSMDFYPWELGNPTTTNRLGILEPRSELALTPTPQTAVLVPCVAVDRSGHRVGYGGGYFDRYLARFPKPLRIGVCYQHFVVSSLPYEPFDERLQQIATENGVQVVEDE